MTYFRLSRQSNSVIAMDQRAARLRPGRWVAVMSRSRIMPRTVANQFFAKTQDVDPTLALV
jgi:hypothetical protein